MSDPVIHSIDDYEPYFQDRLSRLSPSQRIAFTAAMAERYLPVYQAFSEAEEWGDPASLRHALDAVWNHLCRQALKHADLDRYAHLIDDSTPHMDDFDDAEEALAAAVLVGEAVSCCRSADNLAPAIQAAISGFEAVQPGWSDDPRDQPRLWQKIAVRQEYSQQLWLLDQVQAMQTADEAAIKALRKELTKKEHAGKTPKRRATAGPPRLTNQTLFEQYRRMVEADIKNSSRGWGQLESLPNMRPTLLFSRWAARYSRRRQSIDSSYGAPADTAAQQALVVRSKAIDTAFKGTPNWEPDLRSMIDRSLTFGGNDVRSAEEPHGYGPSARRLWIEAKNQGLSDAEAWEQLAVWANHRPTAWELEDRRKKKGWGSVFPNLAEHLAQRVEWHTTADPLRPWTSEVDGHLYQIRLNDPRMITCIPCSWKARNWAASTTGLRPGRESKGCLSIHTPLIARMTKPWAVCGSGLRNTCSRRQVFLIPIPAMRGVQAG
jgi:uncharacterized protein YjaG (DUF416 family)